MTQFTKQNSIEVLIEKGLNCNRPVARNVVWRGFECRRHSNGGAESADGGWVWGGGILLPSGGGVWEGLCPLPRKKIWYFLL